MEFTNTTCPISAKYWEAEADRYWSDAVVLIHGNASKESVLDKLHGTVERDIKAMLARQGRLTDAHRHHQLVRLAKDAGLWSGLDETSRKMLVCASNLHQDASYPLEEKEARIWSANNSFKALARGLKALHVMLCEQRVKAEVSNGGEADEC